MSEANNKVESKESKDEVKRIRSRNSYDTINQIMETYNKSNGWALKKVNMIGMNIDVVVERSVEQATKVEKTSTKEVSNAKQSKEETSKENEPQAESKEVVVDVDDTQAKADGNVKTNASSKPAAKRGRAAAKK